MNATYFYEFMIEWLVNINQWISLTGRQPYFFMIGGTIVTVLAFRIVFRGFKR